MTTTTIGRSAGSKPVNLSQLQDELRVAGVDVDALGMSEGYVYTYDADGQPADFPDADEATVDQALADHVAMRDKTDAEYSAEFQNPSTTAERKQEIRDITAGLIPREQVPM